jgi:large subunit ribosomal protein L29
MKKSELREKSIIDLEKEIADSLRTHFSLRMQKATQQLTNHSLLGSTRRNIALVKTILAEKRAVIK